MHLFVILKGLGLLCAVLRGAGGGCVDCRVP